MTQACSEVTFAPVKTKQLFYNLVRHQEPYMLRSIKVSGWLTQLKRCVDKLSKSTYPSLAPITVFVISGLQSVIY